MKTIRRLTVVVACCSAAFSFSSPPPPTSASTSTPAKPAVAATITAVAAEYPLSCNALAKPIVFRAWDALANSRMDEARDSLELAVAADPKCVMARASLGSLTAGAEGRKLFDQALEELALLNEVERLDLQAMEAGRNADPEKAYSLAQQLVTKAPNVFVVNLTLAHHAMNLEKWEEAGIAAKKATELMPMNGAGWNLLGYSKLHQKKHREAITAFRHYVELAPGEPNAHDSLADALLADDQLDDAAREYQRAIDGSAGRFWFAWSGIATVKALKGDFAGARAAIASQKAAAVRPADKAKTNFMTAWTFAAQGKLPDALKAVDQAQKEARAGKLDGIVAHGAVLKGQLNLASGKYADALKAFTAAEKLKVDLLSDGQKRSHRGLVLAGLTEAQARLDKVADAEKTLATLDEFVKVNLTGPFAADTMAYSRGVVALAKNDPKAAVTSLSKCSELFDYCRMTLADAQDRAGEPMAASETRATLLKANHREAEYWFVRAQLEAKIKGPAM
ncbi:MAG: tetratricopeptide repeat protein [Archangium sp.]|nr:tetratricopeptide repeat protein [Archangium sp.]